MLVNTFWDCFLLCQRDPYMRNKNNTELSQDTNDMSASERDFAYLKEIPSIIKYYIKSLFTWIFIPYGIVVSALQLAGIVNMGIAHILLISAGMIAILSIWLSDVCAKSKKYSIVTMFVVVGFLIVIDRAMVYIAEYQQRESDPQVKVYIKKGYDEIYITIRAERYVSTLALDVPIVGKFINIHEHFSVTEAVTVSQKIVGENSETSINNIELFIEKIQPKNDIVYRILFRRYDNVYVTGIYRYKVSYIWQYRGDILSKEQWFSLITGEPVKDPLIKIRGFKYINKGFTPEEARKDFEEGIKKHEVK